MAEGTIVWRFTQMINKDPQLAKAYNDAAIIRKYGLFARWDGMLRCMVC